MVIKNKGDRVQIDVGEFRARSWRVKRDEGGEGGRATYDGLGFGRMCCLIRRPGSMMQRRESVAD